LVIVLYVLLRFTDSDYALVGWLVWFDGVSSNSSYQLYMLDFQE
jgi:hypothetical protein